MIQTIENKFAMRINSRASVNFTPYSNNYTSKSKFVFVCPHFSMDMLVLCDKLPVIFINEHFQSMRGIEGSLFCFFDKIQREIYLPPE